MQSAPYPKLGPHLDIYKDSLVLGGLVDANAGEQRRVSSASSVDAAEFDYGLSLGTLGLRRVAAALAGADAHLASHIADLPRMVYSRAFDAEHARRALAFAGFEGTRAPRVEVGDAL
jgi:hypothetical protein